MSKLRSFAWIVVSFLLSAPAAACLWDYDTLRDERKGLPGAAEVLAGKWERHSRFFYENRVTRMRALIAKEPANWDAYDNLAVALLRLDQVDEAIATEQKKESLNPRQYTTYSNLGTFYMVKGELEPCIEYLRKALAINPDAHFGREEYQLKLAEFLRDGKTEPRLLTTMNFLHLRNGAIVDPKTFPPLTQPSDGADQPEMRDYSIYEGSPRKLESLSLKPNVLDGIIGMIRFGPGGSAELHLTLGDLLALRGDKNLAYRAYQRALDLNHPRTAHLKDAMRILKEQSKDQSALDEKVIAGERAEAEKWVTAYQQFEDDLIRAGKDPDDEKNLAAFYEKHGKAVLPEPWSTDDLLPSGFAMQWWFEIKVATVVLLPIAALMVWWWFRRLKSRRAIRQ